MVARQQAGAFLSDAEKQGQLELYVQPRSKPGESGAASLRI